MQLKRKEQHVISDINAPSSDLAEYHQQLSEKFQNANPDDLQASADALALIQFNGYYALDNVAGNKVAGAFFAIDTNMHMKEGWTQQIYDVSLIVSLDGTSSERIPFTGSFDGTTLIQTSSEPGGLEFNLTLTHTDVSGGTTATCSGTIGYSGAASQSQISGSTYNNPIPANLFSGSYLVPLRLSPSFPSAVDVMEIKEDFNVLYDYGTQNGNLQSVPWYIYNMNMYYFSFPQDRNATTLSKPSVQLIMGTAGDAGFACNNMVVDANNHVTSRSLQTIAYPDSEKLTNLPNLLSEELAAFSGYYPLTAIAPKAFLTVQAKYIAIDGALDIYIVNISVSLDGKTAKGYYFDGSKMSFENNTLHMPDQNITVKFTREYNATNRSLVTINASIGDHKNITAYTLFNPVPLSAFGGVTMTNAKGDTLTIDNNSKIVYNNTTMDNFIYVPLMYILAGPASKPSTVLSLGTSGTSGNVCIVIQASGTSFVYSIPPKA